MDNKLTKSLTDLIDETLQELDELRKSRFAASEVEIKGPGEGIDGKPSNGKLDAAKADDEDEEEDEEEDEKDMDKGENEEAAKADDEEACKADDDDKDEDDAEDMDKKEDEDKDKKKDKDAKGGEKHEAQERKAIGKLADLADMKKSLGETESLMKSYVEERVKPLEDKLSTILDLVNKIADAPIAPKGVTARATTPLFKSADEAGEPLTKAQVANKLFEMKKSGSKVDSSDIVKAEMGQDLNNLIKKYEIS